MFRQSREGGRGELSALADARGGRFPPRPEFDVSHLGSFRPGWPRGQHIPVDSPPERNPQEKLSQRGQRARRVGRAVHGGRPRCSRGLGCTVHGGRAALFTGDGPRCSQGPGRAIHGSWVLGATDAPHFPNDEIPHKAHSCANMRSVCAGNITQV